MTVMGTGSLVSHGGGSGESASDLPQLRSEPAPSNYSTCRAKAICSSLCPKASPPSSFCLVSLLLLLLLLFVA